MLYNLEGSATLVAQLFAMTHPYRQTDVFAHPLKSHGHIHKRRHTWKLTGKH